MMKSSDKLGKKIELLEEMEEWIELKNNNILLIKTTMYKMVDLVSKNTLMPKFTQ